MARTAAFLLAAALGAAGLATGFWFGFREGAMVGLMLDSVPRAFVTTIHLRAIEKGKPEVLVGHLEGEVDQALLWAGDLDDKLVFPLLGPLWQLNMPDRQKWLRGIADYRKLMQSPFSPDSLSQTLPPAKDAEAERKRVEDLEAMREREIEVLRMVERYKTRDGPQQTP